MPSHKYLVSKTHMSSTPEFMTFVLGAGSSYEVNMPTGSDLKDKIASSLAFKVDTYSGPHFRDSGLSCALS